jgi:hypothetical protein
MMMLWSIPFLDTNDLRDWYWLTYAIRSYTRVSLACLSFDVILWYISRVLAMSYLNVVLYSLFLTYVPRDWYSLTYAFSGVYFPHWRLPVPGRDNGGPVGETSESTLTQRGGFPWVFGLRGLSGRGHCRRLVSVFWPFLNSSRYFPASRQVNFPRLGWRYFVRFSTLAYNSFNLVFGRGRDILIFYE